MTDASGKTTTNHEEIKDWAKERGAQPSVVKGTENDGKGEGVLRFNFPGYSGDNLEQISWDEFFKTFDEKHLAFLYQDKTANGDQSNFCKFVSA